MGEAIKAITIKLSLNRLQGLLILLGIVLIIAGFQYQKAGYFKKAYAYALKSEVTITVTDKETSKGLPATVDLIHQERSEFNKTATLNENGTITINNLVAGSYKAEVKYRNYLTVYADVKVNRGKNNTLSYQLAQKPPEKSVVSGKIRNYISEVPISEVIITIESSTAKSNKDGSFSFSQIITGERQVVVKNVGYLDYTKKINVTEGQFDLGTIDLVPVGKVVYTSNKDKGKRGIYTANYDGSDAKPLIARVGDYEDFGPITSPDLKKVAFLSTREGQKDGSAELMTLYIVDIDGKNLTKIGERVDYSYYWSDNSKYLIWNDAYKENNQLKNRGSIYSIEKQAKSIIITNNNNTYQHINTPSTKTAYTLSNAGKYELYIYNISTDSSTKVLENNVSLFVINFNSENELVYGTYQDNQQKYFTLNLTDNSSKPTDYQYPKRNVVKSPNGKLVSYIEPRDGKTNAFVADNSEGKNEKQMSTIDAANGSPYWSTDSKLVFFGVAKTGENALYVASVDGGTAKKIVDVSTEGYGYY